MNIDNPLVSAIVPVFNAEAFLDESLGSILSQDYSFLEIIVVDDGSEDSTKAVSRKYGNQIRYFQQKNQGPSAARNHGLKQAKGELISFLDADDLWPNNKLSVQVACFRKYPSPDVVLGLTQLYVLDMNSPKTPVFIKHADPWLFQHLGCALFKKSVFEKIGYFDSNLRIGEDTDFFLRIREQHMAVEVIDEVTLKFRLHQNNITKNTDFISLHLNLFKRSIDRRRSQNHFKPESLPNLSSFRKKGAK